MRYESLTEDPERETRAVCEFLGIPWTREMLEYGMPGVVTKGLGDWQDKIRSGSVQPGRALPAPGEIPDALRPMCRSWGYL
ncbi:sulfotransferase domain-containing protein [Nocardia aurea]|uniref:sulfotransferase domain-containing protein n=1 Tax=Nocardia aurea TaxID=2144174 RepID=UPI0018E55A0F|nr:sulfotransferase domain-containing protein [Nocardia aurea]